MDDILLILLLKKKGIISDKDIHEFHETLSYGMKEEPVYNMEYANDILNEYYEWAKELVSKMYHVDNGRKYIGERFSIDKAKEVYDKYKEMLSSSVTYCDIYVAINSHYHNLISLYKSWFGDKAECRLIESAMIFWFMDEDYKDNKVHRLYKD